MKQTPAEKESPEIVGYMTKEQFQEYFRKADEKTSGTLYNMEGNGGA